MRDSGLAEIIRFILRPTIAGLIYLPLILLYNAASNITYFIPGNIGLVIWDIYDSAYRELCRCHMNAIKNDPCLWDIELWR